MQRRPITLRDGRAVTLRSSEAKDLAAFVAAFGKLSSESRHSRFMASVKVLPEALLARAVLPSPEQDAQLVAEDEKGEIVGAGHEAILPDRRSCEFSVTVADGWRGIGLASALMRELIADARGRGLERMEGWVLSENTAMLDLARRLGFQVLRSPDDPAVRQVVLDLDPQPTSNKAP